MQEKTVVVQKNTERNSICSIEKLYFLIAKDVVQFVQLLDNYTNIMGFKYKIKQNKMCFLHILWKKTNTEMFGLFTQCL